MDASRDNDDAASPRFLVRPERHRDQRFKYMDNDLTNTKADPSNLDPNKGIVSNLYKPYPDLLEMMRELNCNVYVLRDFLGK